MLQRKWSAQCELGEMRYKFRFQCTEVFQLVDTSDFGLTFASDYTNGKRFQFCLFYVTDSKIVFVANRRSNLSK